jgi:hypothetical protein
MTQAQRRLLLYLRDVPKARVLWSHIGPFTEPDGRNAQARTIRACRRRGWLLVSYKPSATVYRLSAAGRKALTP